jgi:cytochrome c-type biogenesis protein CcmF
VVAVGLLLWRLPKLRSENELDSMLSRESAFLLNNLVLVGIAFAVFWGTVFPVISEAVRGVKITVGPPFFNRVNAPLGLILLFLTGVGPVIAWRRASVRNLQKSFLLPISLGLLGGAILFAAGIRHYYALLSLSLCIFVLATIVMEFFRGTRARQAMLGENPVTALLRLISKNRRRYGGYLIHVGVVMMILAITGTSAFKEEKQITVKPGDTFPMGRYTLRYEGVHPHETPHIAYLTAALTVLDNGRQVEVLRPEKRFYKRPEQPTTEVAIRSTLGGDLYVVLGSYDDASKMATIQAYVNPLVSFLWWGGIVLALGTAVTIWPARVPARAPVYADAGPRGRVLAE